MNQQRPWIAWADCLAQIRPRLGLGQLSLQPIPKFVLLVAFLVLAADLAFLYLIYVQRQCSQHAVHLPRIGVRPRHAASLGPVPRRHLSTVPTCPKTHYNQASPSTQHPATAL